MQMKKIVDRFDKQSMANLPRVLYEGRIEVVVSEDAAKRAVKYLLKQPMLGFDTETRPSFVRGKMYKVALLQVCSDEICFLFRLNQIDLPQCLVKLLSDKKITKIGLSWHDDIHGLLARKQFKPGTFIDLQNVAADMGIQDMSLQKLYANILGGKISKGQQLSNWEADSLSEPQKRYAATDAWACIQLYREMMRMQEEGYELQTPQPPLGGVKTSISNEK